MKLKINKNFLKNSYNWCAENSKSKNAKRAMYLISFAESSFFPLPPDLLLIPMMLHDKKNVFKLAFFATFFSVLGGVLGYFIGYYLFNILGHTIIEYYNLTQAFTKFQLDFHKYGFAIIALKGLTPIPFKLVTIASGLIKFNFVQFLLASIIARSFRFYLLAALFYFFGDRAKKIIEEYLGIFLISSLAVIIAGFLLIKLFYN